MEFFETVEKRKSVRKYSDRPVEREILDKMAEAAASAPSSKNTKSSALMLVEDPDTLSALSEMRERGSSFLKGAKAAFIVMGNDSKTDLWETNAAITATYLLLAATAMDLGSCWIQVSGREGRHTPLAEDYVKEILGIREGLHVLCIVALGYPQEDQAQA